MKTAAYNLLDEQIAWIKKKAENQGKSTASAIVRKIISDAMEKDAQEIKDHECGNELVSTS
ncbi:MAG: hypothetical protein GYA45_11685 [Pelolinea sp.]|nr:hypothetical protein [Pelolinea sp.]